MNLTCPRCSGKVIVDSEYTFTTHIEFTCVICGWRRIYDNPEDEFIQDILKSEQRRGRVRSGPAW